MPPLTNSNRPDSVPDRLPRPTDRRDLISEIHDHPHQIVLAVTGGGSLALSQLLTVPGASRTVLEAFVPYCSRSLIEWLGEEPEQFCSAATARAMAMAAFTRACHLKSAADQQQQNPTPQQLASRLAAKEALIGLGCTCSLASDRPKRGKHRAHLGIQTASSTRVFSVTLIQRLRSRAAEEELIADWMLTCLARACDLTVKVPTPWAEGEQPVEDRVDPPEDWTDLLLGNQHAVPVTGTAQDTSGPPPAQQPTAQQPTAQQPTAKSPPPQSLSPQQKSPSRRVIFPGSFHPVHQGHRQMMQRAAAETGQAVELEISITNVDKAPLDFWDIDDRISQFPPDQRIWLTRAPRFTDKVRLFENATFIVGADTLRRIADPCYYAGDQSARDRAVAEIAACGGQFLVFGRLDRGQFQTLESMDLPENLQALCIEISEFREDISSTELRRRAPRS